MLVFADYGPSPISTFSCTVGILIVFILNGQERESGQRLNIIIVSEGAIDREGNPITAEMIREVFF